MAMVYTDRITDITRQQTHQNLLNQLGNANSQMANLQQAYANQASQATLAQYQHLQGRANDGRQFLMAVEQGASSQVVQQAQQKLWAEIQHYEAKAREAAAEEAYRAYTGDWPKIEEKVEKTVYKAAFDMHRFFEKLMHWPIGLLDWSVGLL